MTGGKASVSLRAAPFVWIVIGLLGVTLLAGSFLSARPRLVWNSTASAPIGLYIVEDRAWTKGDRVAVRPDPFLLELLVSFDALEADQILIKRAAAISGDDVCRNGFLVTINGAQVAKALQVAGNGLPLPSWTGCRRLAGGEVFLLGDTERSFDGRYFGVVGSDAVIGPVSQMGRSQRN